MYVCFYTANREVIFQKRSDTKKNGSGKLTTTVSGHVASGQSYAEAAVRETLEETGIQISPDDLKNLGVIRDDYAQGDYLSNAMRGLFAYKFDGTIADLKVEDGEGAGFEVFDIDELEIELEASPNKFADVFTGECGKKIIQGLKVSLR